MTDQETIDELMCALEYLRYACEHAEGKRSSDTRMLTRAMSVGNRILDKHKDRIPDAYKGTYWDRVWSMPVKVGLEPLAKIQP